MTDDVSEVLALVLRDPARRAALEALAALALPDAWLAAGFVRNAVWDARFGAAAEAADLDVVYFDPADPSPARDRALEARLTAAHPGPAWSVKNQARMHTRNGHPPYADTADAVARWPETATCVGARLGPGGAAELLAAYGVGDLLAGVVRPSPGADLGVYRARLAGKRWAARWPGLVVRTG